MIALVVPMVVAAARMETKEGAGEGGMIEKGVEVVLRQEGEEIEVEVEVEETEAVEGVEEEVPEEAERPIDLLLLLHHHLLVLIFLHFQGQVVGKVLASTLMRNRSQCLKKGDSAAYPCNPKQVMT